MDSANWKYDPPVDCMSIVCGAIVMMRLAPTRSQRSAWAMNVGFRPFSRSMSMPSKPYDCMSANALFENAVAAAELATWTRPSSPRPTG